MEIKDQIEFSKLDAKEKFRRFLEHIKQKGVIGFKEIPKEQGGIYKGADFIINLQAHLERSGVSYNRDLVVKIEDHQIQKGVKKYEKKGICLVVINSSLNDLEEIRERFIGAQEEFLAQGGGKEFRMRIRKKIIGQVATTMKRAYLELISSLRKTIGKIVKKHKENEDL